MSAIGAAGCRPVAAAAAATVRVHRREARLLATAAAVPTASSTLNAAAMYRAQLCSNSSQRNRLCSSVQQQQRQRHCPPRHRLAAGFAAACSGSNGDAASAEDEGEDDFEEYEDEEEEDEGEEEGPPPTEEELEEARRVLQDFLEGMGAAGEVSRPQDMDLPEDRLTWAEVAQMVGMTGWRLADKVCAPIEQLVAHIEGCFRGVLPEDQFGLYNLDEKYKYLDSLDPQGADPFSFRSMVDPEKGEPGYPRLQIENRVYCSRAFRKLHIEVAVRQDGLQVFHCVMYPRLEHDLPILSMDLVANDGRVTLAIVDPCPTTPNLELPPFYEQPVRELQARYGLESNRSIPDWGRAIFSQLCVIVRPSSSEELGSFLKYALALTQMHVQLAKISHPVGGAQWRRLELLHAAHQRYCNKQLENDKTRRVLEAAFGAELAERYMREVMFDCPQLPANT